MRVCRRSPHGRALHGPRDHRFHRSGAGRHLLLFHRGQRRRVDSSQPRSHSRRRHAGAGRRGDDRRRDDRRRGAVTRSDRGEQPRCPGYRGARLAAQAELHLREGESRRNSRPRDRALEESRRRRSRSRRTRAEPQALAAQPLRRTRPLSRTGPDLRADVVPRSDRSPRALRHRSERQHLERIQDDRLARGSPSDASAQRQRGPHGATVEVGATGAASPTTTSRCSSEASACSSPGRAARRTASLQTNSSPVPTCGSSGRRSAASTPRRSSAP